MLPKTSFFLSLRQKSEIFATSLVRGRHGLTPQRPPIQRQKLPTWIAPLRAGEVSVAVPGGLRADAPYGESRRLIHKLTGSAGSLYSTSFSRICEEEKFFFLQQEQVSQFPEQPQVPFFVRRSAQTAHAPSARSTSPVPITAAPPRSDRPQMRQTTPRCTATARPAPF